MEHNSKNSPNLREFQKECIVTITLPCLYLLHSGYPVITRSVFASFFRHSKIQTNYRASPNAVRRVEGWVESRDILPFQPRDTPELLILLANITNQSIVESGLKTTYNHEKSLKKMRIKSIKKIYGFKICRNYKSEQGQHYMYKVWWKYLRNQKNIVKILDSKDSKF